MWVLVPFEIHYLDVPMPVDPISQDEFFALEFVQESVRILIVVGEDLDLDPARPILQTPLTIGECPETDEKQPGKRIELCEQFVLEKGGLDVPGTWHASVFLFR